MKTLERQLGRFNAERWNDEKSAIQSTPLNCIKGKK
jgi:hypothetical protein